MNIVGSVIAIACLAVLTVVAVFTAAIGIILLLQDRKGKNKHDR